MNCTGADLGRATCGHGSVVVKSACAMSMPSYTKYHAPSVSVRHAQRPVWLTAISAAAEAASCSAVYLHNISILLCGYLKDSVSVSWIVCRGVECGVVCRALVGTVRRGHGSHRF